MPKNKNYSLKYTKSFCGKLYEHMKKGHSFESFAATARVTPKTLYSWVKSYPEFREAKEKGEPASLLHYERVGMAAMTGQLTSIKSRKIALDGDKKPIRDEDGKFVYEEEYTPARINAQMFSLMIRSRFKFEGQFETGDDSLSADMDLKELSDKELAQEMKKTLEVLQGGKTG